MNRRVSLPGADELFRSTGAEGPDDEGDPRTQGPDTTVPEASGRTRHDQKITVYLTSQELLELEQARLRLRAEFDLGVDRGRIVREAIAVLLQDLQEQGPDAALLRRLG